MGRFSHDYDALINRVANDLVQIYSDDKKEGLFVVNVNAIYIRYLVSTIKEDTTFDSFLDFCFELFWKGIDQCLKNIRQHIDAKLKADVNQLFGTLEGDITRLAEGSSTSDLDRAIRTAQTNAQLAFDRVKEWFRLSQPLSIPELSFEYLVDVGLQCVKSIHPDFDPILTQSMPELPKIEGGLELFSDILTIIFDNIQRHSGITRRPRVEITATELTDRLQLVIRNEVAPGVRTPEVEAKVTRIKQAITDGVYQRTVSSEGGTGFIKLRKIIGGDQRTPLRLDFGFGEDDRFFVALDIRAHKREIDAGEEEMEVKP